MSTSQSRSSQRVWKRIPLILAVFALLLWPNLAAAQSYTVAPSPFLTILDNSGSGAFLQPGPLVARLGKAIGPAAISRGVWPIVIDAVQRQAFRSWSHVSEKAAEVGTPFVAHENTAATVVVEVSITRILAAVLRGGPHHVLERASTVARGPVGHGESSRAFAAETSAAFGQAISQAWADNFMGRAAVTSAEPSRLPIAMPFRHLANDNQHPKAVARQLNEMRHG